MYLPSHFDQRDPAVLHDLVAAHPLATWVCVVEGQPVINHLPLHLDPTRGPKGTLIGHVARANPVWKTPPSHSVAVFQGEQAYVTPNWYPSKPEHGKVVPTWNYAVVHAHGLPRFIEDPQVLHAIVSRLTDHHEAAQPRPWSVDDAPQAYTDAMLRAIVGVEIEVTEWVGKFKLSQNRSAADREGVQRGAAGGGEAERAMAAAMEAAAARVADDRTQP